jgi:hypothetical protein
MSHDNKPHSGIIGKENIARFVKAAFLPILLAGISLTGCKTVRKAESAAQQPPQVKLVKKQYRRRKRFRGIRIDRTRSKIRILVGYPTLSTFLLAAILRNVEPTVRNRMESPTQQPAALR